MEDYINSHPPIVTHNILFKFIVACTFILLWSISTTAFSKTSLEIVKTYPDTSSHLAQNAIYYVNVKYKSPEDIILVVTAFDGEKLMSTTGSAPALLKSGEGDDMIWFMTATRKPDKDHPVYVDKIVVTAYYNHSKDVAARIDMPVSLSYDSTSIIATDFNALPSWVTQKVRDHDRKTGEEIHAANKKHATLNILMMIIQPLSIVGYLFLQGYSLVNMRKKWFACAAAPLIIMAFILVYAVYAVMMKGSNIAPVLILLAVEPLFIYLLCMTILWYILTARKQKA